MQGIGAHYLNRLSTDHSFSQVVSAIVITIISIAIRILKNNPPLACLVFSIGFSVMFLRGLSSAKKEAERAPPMSGGGATGSRGRVHSSSSSQTDANRSATAAVAAAAAATTAAAAFAVAAAASSSKKSGSVTVSVNVGANANAGAHSSSRTNRVALVKKLPPRPGHHQPTSLGASLAPALNVIDDNDEEEDDTVVQAADDLTVTVRRGNASPRENAVQRVAAARRLQGKTTALGALAAGRTTPTAASSTSTDSSSTDLAASAATVSGLVTVGVDGGVNAKPVHSTTSTSTNSSSTDLAASAVTTAIAAATVAAAAAVVAATSSSSSTVFTYHADDQRGRRRGHNRSNTTVEEPTTHSQRPREEPTTHSQRPRSAISRGNKTPKSAGVRTVDPTTNSTLTKTEYIETNKQRKEMEAAGIAAERRERIAKDAAAAAIAVFGNAAAAGNVNDSASTSRPRPSIDLAAAQRENPPLDPAPELQIEGQPPARPKSAAAGRTTTNN